MTEVSLIIREARVDDAEALVALLVGGTLSPEHEDQRDLEPYRVALAEIGESEHALVLVAERGGTIIGMGQLIFFRHLQHRGGLCAELESLHVAEPFRGQGIGSRLLARASEIASERGAYRLQLTSNLQRKQAHRLYEREGFLGSHLGFKRALPFT